MTVIDISKALWRKLAGIGKFYNDRPIALGMSAVLLIWYVSLLDLWEDDFWWSLHYQFFVSKNAPIAWTSVGIVTALLLIIAKFIKR